MGRLEWGCGHRPMVGHSGLHRIIRRHEEGVTGIAVLGENVTWSFLIHEDCMEVALAALAITLSPHCYAPFFSPPCRLTFL